MIDDRNKTEITRKATTAALCYLLERGFKPLETEVPICPGWIADAAGVVTPTPTDLVGMKLMRAKPKWANTPEYRTKAFEWHEQCKSLSRLFTALIEVKTSRGDFRGDKKWKLPAPTNLMYLVIPADLDVRTDEFPQGWGVLEYSETREQVRCIKPPAIHEVGTIEQLSVVLEIAVRQHNIDAYTRLREIQREQRIRTNEDVSRVRLQHAMLAVLAIVEGKYGSIEGCLERYQIKHHSPYIMEELAKLWPKAPKQEHPNL